jgi:hypothetical protein
LPNRIEEGDAEMTVSSAPGLISSIGVGEGTSQSSNNTRAPEELGRPTLFTPPTTRRSLVGEPYLPDAKPSVRGGAYSLVGDTFSLSSRDTTPTPRPPPPLPSSQSSSSSSSSVALTTLGLFFPVVGSPLSGATNRLLRCAPCVPPFAGVLAFGVFTANLAAPSPRDDRDPTRDVVLPPPATPPRASSPPPVVVVVVLSFTFFKFIPEDGRAPPDEPGVFFFPAVAAAAARNAL